MNNFDKPDEIAIPLSREAEIEHGIHVIDYNGFTPKYKPSIGVSYPGDPDKFMVIRFVIDLVLDDNRDETGEEPFFKFRIYFSKEDLLGRSSIKIGKLVRDEWEIIDKKPIFLFNQRIWVGYFELTFTSPGDPPIALGE